MNAQDFEKSLQDIVGSQNVRPDEPLSEHTTFRIGGPAQWLVTPRSEDEVAGWCQLARRLGFPGAYWDSAPTCSRPTRDLTA